MWPYCRHDTIKTMALISLLLPCLLFVSYTAVAVLGQDCVYTIYVQTGTVDKAGTDSKISLSLYNEQGEVVSVENLENWGIMERGHDYFENGHLDIFSGKYKCLSSPVCKMNVTSDGAKAYAEWYLNYIDVVTLQPGAICYHQKFEVNKWLADNEPPYKLWASKDYCPAFTKALDADGVIQTRPAI